MAQVSAEPFNDARPEEGTLKKPSMIKEFVSGLTVSFAAMSLGAAFGDQSGRGALKGVLSAGCLALITSIVGGTKVQCSGPTAPMTAVTVTLTAYAAKDFVTDFPDKDPELFVNMSILLAGLILLLLGICRVGRLIEVVPAVVISGFMNGIAVMVWVPQIQALYGWGKPQMKGAWWLNTVFALTTTFLIFNVPKFTGKFCPQAKSFLPGTLIAIVLVSGFVFVCGGFGVQTVAVGDPISSFGQVGAMFSENIPTEWSWALIAKALPYSLPLALLGFIDTLLTTCIVDQKVQEMYKEGERWRETNKNLELVGQGLSNGAVALFGGIPGAQATIRSVLILKEGAMTQAAGVLAGLFTIIEIAALQSLVKLIPQCVLTGVLFKVGYDCFDWLPFTTYINTQILRQEHPGKNDPTRANDPVVPHSNFLFIIGTCVANSFFPLHIVVPVSCILFHVGNFIMKIPDLQPYQETVKPSEGVVLA